MLDRLVALRQRHQGLDRLIDNRWSILRQEELKALKRERLRLKDRMVAMQRLAHTATH